MKKKLDAVFDALVKTGVNFPSHYHRPAADTSIDNQPEPSSSRATSLDPTTWAATISRVQNAAQLSGLPRKLLEGGETSFLAEKAPAVSSTEEVPTDLGTPASIFDIEVSESRSSGFQVINYGPGSLNGKQPFRIGIRILVLI